MPPSTTRRALLAASATAATAALAGCTGFLDSRTLAHEVEVFNQDATAHTLAVAVTDDSDDVLYQRTFQLAAEHAEEGTEPFTGTPTTIAVRIDDGSPTEYAWPDPNCEDRGMRSAGGAGIHLTSDGDVRIEPTCNTVYVE